MKILSVSLLIVLTTLPFHQAPVSVTNGWLVFAKVRFTERFFKELNEYFLVPFFDSKIRHYENREILLKGHYLPFDLKEKNTVIISKYPYAACFFCGGAGPESVAEVRFKGTRPRFKTDELIHVSGKLLLNDTDIDHMNFILKDAELVSP